MEVFNMKFMYTVLYSDYSVYMSFLLYKWQKQQKVIHSIAVFNWRE